MLLMGLDMDHTKKTLLAEKEGAHPMKEPA